jgi:hypothetical protein
MTGIRRPEGQTPQVELDPDGPPRASLKFFGWRMGSWGIKNLLDGVSSTPSNGPLFPFNAISPFGPAWGFNGSGNYAEFVSYQPVVTNNGAGTGDFTFAVIANPSANSGGGDCLMSHRIERAEGMALVLFTACSWGLTWPQSKFLLTMLPPFSMRPSSGDFARRGPCVG